MKTTTIALIFNESNDSFLMGYHQRGEGKGKLNFIGGKVADKPEFVHETAEESILREVKEETGLIAQSVHHCADIFYIYPEKFKDKNELMKVYRVTDYEGEIIENPDELKLIWIKVNNLPFEEMWESDTRWLPEILKANGRFVQIEFEYDAKKNLIKETILAEAKE